MLTRRDLKITAVFTAVEVVTLGVWQVLGPTAQSTGILIVGLLLEHLISRLKG